MHARFFGVLAAAAALAFGSSGCQSDVDAKLALAGLSSSCRINSDCSSELACVFERCHEQCASSRDCERGSRCVAGRGKRNVCQLEDEASCGERGNCPGEQLCGVDGKCRDGCDSDAACLTGQVCRSGTCADLEELTGSGELAPAPERPDAALLPCAFDSDCPGKLVCRAGSCVSDCEKDTDCPASESCTDGACTSLPPQATGCLRSSDCKAGEECVAGTCQPSPMPPKPECNYDSDCKAPGQYCANGSCQCECKTSSDCRGSETCQGSCQCVPGRVIQGSVTIDNDRQLAAISDVVEITGQLYFQIQTVGEYHLPSLQKVGLLTVAGTSLVVADALEEVSQELSCYGNCSVPKLKRAGSVNFNVNGVGKIELPALVSTGDFNIWYNSQLQAVSAPLLTTAATVRLEGNDNLTSIDLPELATLTSLTVSRSAKLTQLSLAKANPSNALGVFNMPALETISLPALTSTSSDITIDNNDRLRSVDLSGLKTGRQLSLTRLPYLRELLLPNLTTLSESFTLSNCPGPDTLELPALEQARVLNCSNTTKVARINAPLLKTLFALTLNGPSLVDLDLPVEAMTGPMQLDNLPALASVTFKQLTAVDGLLVRDAPALTKLALPKLLTAGDVILENTGLTDLNSLTSGLGGALKSAGTLGIDANPRLPVCAVNAFVTALFDQGWSSTMNLAQNLDCPCNGAVCQ